MCSHISAITLVSFIITKRNVPKLQKSSSNIGKEELFFNSVCLVVAFFLLQEKQRMTDKLEDTSLRLKDEMDLYRKIMDKLWHNRHEFQKEKEAMQEVRHSR